MPKKDAYYFDSFVECAVFCGRQAALLQDSLRSFHTDALPGQLQRAAEISRGAELRRRELMQEVACAFVTPLEREDILQLGREIERVTVSIEKTLSSLYMENIPAAREESLPLAEILGRACEALQALLEEFRGFKKSKRLTALTAEVSALKEEGDALLLEAVRRLAGPRTELAERVAWREVYRCFDANFEACEQAAFAAEHIAIANT